MCLAFLTKPIYRTSSDASPVPCVGPIPGIRLFSLVKRSRALRGRNPARDSQADGAPKALANPAALRDGGVGALSPSDAGAMPHKIPGVWGLAPKLRRNATHRFCGRAKIFDPASGSAYFQDWATRVVSTKDTEKYRWMGSLPTMREWGTGRKVRGVYTESYDVDNLKYEITLEVDRDEIADDQTDQIMMRIRELGTRAAQHKDYLLSLLLANGASAGYLAYDGKIFFADDHESGESGAQSNILTPAATDADAPTTAEFKAALGAAITQLLTLKDDHGEPMNPDATGLVAVVPPSMYITALEALSATVISQTTNVLAGAAKVVAFPRLTDASKWFLLKTNVPVRPFIFQDRESIEFKALEGESEAGFMREVYTYGVRARYAITFAAWQHALQLDFTTE